MTSDQQRIKELEELVYRIVSCQAAGIRRSAEDIRTIDEIIYKRIAESKKIAALFKPKN